MLPETAQPSSQPALENSDIHRCSDSRPPTEWVTLRGQHLEGELMSRPAPNLTPLILLTALSFLFAITWNGDVSHQTLAEACHPRAAAPADVRNPGRRSLTTVPRPALTDPAQTPSVHSVTTLLLQAQSAQVRGGLRAIETTHPSLAAAAQSIPSGR